jgi:prepilin-type N-terminal cleavage/methylation domain-containing protein
MSDRKLLSGFTLVELLVVIAIVSVLVSILLPALAKVRASAMSLQCANTMRVIGQAMLLYEMDYEGYMPAGQPAIPTTRTPTGALNWAAPVKYPFWDEFITPYLRRTTSTTDKWTNFYVCPVQGYSTTDEARYNDYMLVGYTDANSGVKYAWNSQSPSKSFSGEMWEGAFVYTQVSLAKAPSRTARLVEGAIESREGNSRKPYPVGRVTADPSVRYLEVRLRRVRQRRRRRDLDTH